MSTTHPVEDEGHEHDAIGLDLTGDQAIDSWRGVAAEDVDDVLVLMAPGYVEDVEKIIAKSGLTKVSRVLEGGATRNETTRLAIDHLSEGLAEGEDRGADHRHRGGEPEDPAGAVGEDEHLEELGEDDRPGGHHRRRVDEGGGGGRALHRVRQPVLERELGRLAEHSDDEERERDAAHPRLG